jgi:hypothetical protein
MLEMKYFCELAMQPNVFSACVACAQGRWCATARTGVFEDVGAFQLKPTMLCAESAALLLF